MLRRSVLALALAGCSSTPDAPTTSEAGESSSSPATTSAVDPTTGTGDTPTTDATTTEPATTTSGTTSEPATTGEPDSTGVSTGPVDPPADPYPDPGAFPPNNGPGGPTKEFAADQVGQECAALDGGMDGDLGDGEVHDTFDHHNLVVMFDGYLVMPWAPEFGLNAGVTFYDFSDPCAPSAVASVKGDEMRESHSLGFAELGGRWYMVSNQMTGLLGDGGVMFWDVTDPQDIKVVSKLELPGFLYPDAYQRVTLAVFWQAPWVYVAGADNGVYVIDASDPVKPVLAKQYKFDPVLRAGQVQAVGNLLMVSAAEGKRTALLNIGKPDFPQPIAGGEFSVERESYFSNIGGGYAYYAPKEGGGGILIHDIHDPGKPTPVADYSSGGNGGYVFVKDQFAFVGESDFATIYDLSDQGAPKELMKLNLVGDLDTITPIANVAVVSVDDKADKDRGSIVVPWQAAADATPPTVTWVYPPDGAEGLAVFSRVGMTFNEMIDVKSAWAGSVRVYEAGTDPATTRVDGHVSVQENIVNFSPKQMLRPGVTYTLEVPAGGVRDYSGNVISQAFTSSFKTAGGE
jgi:hypothetical protein